MADVRPFPGFRFDPGKVRLSRVLCPPYDVIDPPEARRLRKLRLNAIHMELPGGEGPARYRNAARAWRGWRRDGWLRQDPVPALYVCEERFKLGGRTLRRRGFLAALGLESAARSVLAHERTLPKPKADRLRLLRAVKANVSPIFGIFPDPTSRVREALRRASSRRPDAEGTARGGVRYRLWRLSDEAMIARIRRELAPRRILIADGHHRFEVSRAYYARFPSPEAATVLAYLCPEEDSGLVVLSTHRVVAESELSRDARRLCRLKDCRSKAGLLERLAKSRNPYAFGLYEKGSGVFQLAEPEDADGCKSGLCVEWLGRHLLRNVPADRIRYTPDAERAVALARASGAAVFVKPLRVAQIRRAVAAVGLLPPKSTYFYPKIATGLVFKSIGRRPKP